MKTPEEALDEKCKSLLNERANILDMDGMPDIPKEHITNFNWLVMTLVLYGDAEGEDEKRTACTIIKVLQSKLPEELHSLARKEELKHYQRFRN